MLALILILVLIPALPVLLGIALIPIHMCLTILNSLLDALGVDNTSKPKARSNVWDSIDAANPRANKPIK